MPDQGSAADEYALLQEITATPQTSPGDPAAASSEADFPIVLRGYDRLAVDAYVRKTSQLIAELQVTHSPEAAVRRALERVGEQVSGILQRAHETAEQITTQSRGEAEDRLELARREAEDHLQAARREAKQVTAGAEQRVRELDAETDRIWAERRRIVEDARQLAQELLTLADGAGERFPAASDTGEGEVLGAPSVTAEDVPPEDSDLDTTLAFDPPVDPDATISLERIDGETAPESERAGEAEPGSGSAEEGARGSRSGADQAPEPDGPAEPPPAA